MPPASPAFQFGPFTLYPSSRLLLEHGQPVRLGARALDILIALVERSGEVLSREELFRRVWPDTIVEETSLRVHVAALRKALGGSEARYIGNIPGKGYSFMGEVERKGHAATVPPPLPLRSARHNLPVRLTRMIGRGGSTASVASRLLTQRFVTIVGEGGTGKTTLALAVAEACLDEYADGAAFVDLASCASPASLVSTVGRALGLPLAATSGADTLCDVLQGRRLLLVMDNCEHLVWACAELIAELLRRLPALRILATSREPLRAQGEQVHRLETLPVPPPAEDITAARAMEFEAIQLLVERVAALADGFVLGDDDAPFAAELCRRLDGIPLAIELAAARVSFFGLQGLLARLHDRLRILTSGHRTVLPRHQTLRALYDWSFDLLDEAARRAFARLSVFPGSFTLDAALAVIPAEDRSAGLSTFLDLIAKSLVATNLGEERRTYRLLDTARVYAREKLDASGERLPAREAHARWLKSTLEAENANWVSARRAEWVRVNARLTDDIREALEWAASADGDAVLFAQLVACSCMLQLELSQVELFRPHVQRALTLLQERAPEEAQLQQRLTVLHGEVLSHTAPDWQDVEDWLQETGVIFEKPDLHPPVLYAAAVAYLAHGEYRLMLKTAERFELTAEALDAKDAVITGRRLQAQAHHYLGQLQTGSAMALDAMRHPKAPDTQFDYFDPIDRRFSMGILLARTRWLEGDSLAAARHLDAAAALAPAEIDHAKCQLHALAEIPIALWEGDFERAALANDAFRQLTDRRHLVNYWKAWSSAFSALLEGTPIRGETVSAKLLDLLGTLDPACDDDRLLPRALSGAAGWSAAEVIRNHGERIKGRSPDEAARHFLRAIDVARSQGATRWELRAALSLARLGVQDARFLPTEQTLLSPLARMNTATTDRDVIEATACVRSMALMRSR